jgi:hypothetical protein
MAEKPKAVKWHHLTPKALRYMIALNEYDEKLKELQELTDEEVVKLAECEDVLNLCEVNEERKRTELLFDGVACPKCNKLLLPTEDEVKDGWAYGDCCFCGAKLPPLHIAEEVT